MGSVSSNPQNEEFGNLSNLPQHLKKLELKFDIAKEVNLNLRQLLHWSLLEIRGVYEQFQRRCTMPFVDKSMFCKLVPFSRTIACFIFEHFCKVGKLLSIYEFICILTITSYTHYINKVHFLYILFDLDCSGNISLNELLIIFKSIVIGYCKLTEAELPSYVQLEKFAKLMFLKSDIQVDNALELSEIIEWLETNQKGMELFHMFEPKVKMQEPFEAFRPFRAYTEQESLNMMDMITKANKNEYYLKGLSDQQNPRSKNYQQQKKQTSSLPRLGTNHKIPINIDDEIEESNMLENVLHMHQKKYEDQQTGRSDLRLSQPQLLQNLDSKRKMRASTKILKNIIITKGCTLTRSEVFKLKEYFNKLSDGNKVIGVKDFTKAFAEKPHMKRVTASLYNYLDSKQNGFVTFEQMVRKMYPQLTRQQLDLINYWIKQYNETFMLDQKNHLDLDIVKDEKAQKRKRVLPKNSMIRVKQLFELVDSDNKGYINVEDLKKTFTYGYTPKEVEDLFKKHDQDHDGKLQVEDLLRIILPPDYVIEDEEEQT